MNGKDRNVLNVKEGGAQPWAQVLYEFSTSSINTSEFYCTLWSVESVDDLASFLKFNFFCSVDAKLVYWNEWTFVCDLQVPKRLLPIQDICMRPANYGNLSAA